jgi:hypothetical protein
MGNKTSYKRVASAQITTKPGVLHAYAVGTNGMNDATIKIYDTDSAALAADTNCMWECTVPSTGMYGGRNVLPRGLDFKVGLYVELIGAGAFYFIEYK